MHVRITGVENQARRAGTQLPQTRKIRQDMAALGVSRRQLEYWVEMGWVRPAEARISGHPRSFSDAERKVLALLVRLTAAGLPARVAAPVARGAVAAAEADPGEDAEVELAPGLYLTVCGI